MPLVKKMVITENMELVFFLYGLSFFLLGFTTALRRKRSSRLKMAGSLWALSAYGILYGLSEWGEFFIPIQAPHLTATTVMNLRAVQVIMRAAALAFLFHFGADLAARHIPRCGGIRVLPAGIFMGWLLYFVVPGLSWYSVGWTLESETWSRYLLGIPGSLLAGYAMWLQAREFQGMGFQPVAANTRGAAVSLSFHTVLGGLVVPPGAFFPASAINTGSFYLWTGIPVQIWRAVYGLSLTYFILRTLDIFEMESSKRVEVAEKREAVARERERIGRDLHDGTIQCIYAASLKLQNCRYLIRESAERAEEELEQVLGLLNSTMESIRGYIQGLHPLSMEGKDLGDLLEELVRDFNYQGLAVASLDYRGEPPGNLPPDHLANVYFIVKEALNNVARHAGATSVKVRAAWKGNFLEMSVCDNGRGFSLAESGGEQKVSSFGLRSMATRAGLMRGELKIITGPGKGTEVRIKIPYGGGKG